MTGLPVLPTATLTLDTAQSPAIDAGDPASDFSAEPAEHGGRINLGAYGNTAQASKSPAQLVQVLFPNGLEKFELGQAVTIIWRSHGLAAAATVTVEFSTDNGMNWATLATGLMMDASGRGSFLWTAGPQTGSNTALVRVRVEPSFMPEDTTDEPFLVANNGVDYYVNDGALAGDAFTTAVGNNANSGKTPASPLASLTALLAAYNLDGGDVVHVDTGTYRLLKNLLITSQDSGVRIEGPVGAIALLDRGSSAEGSAVIELRDGDSVTLTRLSLTGGRYGIFAAETSDSDDLTVSDSRIFGNTDSGIFLNGTAQSSNDRPQFLRNEIFGNGTPLGQPFGIRLNYSQAILVDRNTLRDLSRDGLTLTNATGNISNNTLTRNTAGLIASASAGLLSIVDNTVSDHAAYGLSVFGQVEVRRNSIQRNQRAGILALGGTVAENVVSDQLEGIVGSGGAIISGNRVFHNSANGIRAYNTASVEGNRSYSNAVGILLEHFDGRAANNLAYANNDAGIIVRASSAELINNTVYQPAGDGVRVETASPSLRLRNSIIRVEAGYAVSVTPDSEAGFASDYNLFHLVGSGRLAEWGAHEFSQLIDWRLELGFDAHSSVREPQFVDPDGPDNLLGYTAGADHGLDDDFRLRSGSPAVDAGDPVTAFSNEPAPNGGRVNLGSDGNTAQATTSPAQLVQVLSPNGLEKVELGQVVTVAWRTVGLPPATTLKIELSTDRGGTWATLAATVVGSSYSWTVAAVETDVALIRVTANGGSMPQDVSDDVFLVANGGVHYYVNDGFRSGDVFTMAIGHNANSGKSPARPMASVRALLAAYDLDPGDIIHVDTGSYRLVANVIIASQDAGVQVEGPANAVALLDRDSVDISSAVIELRDADDVTVTQLSLTGGHYGIFAAETSDSDGASLRANLIYGNAGSGIYFAASPEAANDHVTIADNIIRNNGDGVLFDGTHASVSGNHVYDNEGVGISVRGTDSTVSDNTVYGSAVGIAIDGLRLTVNRNTLYGHGTGIVAVGSGEQVNVTANTVFNNRAIGISAIGDVLVLGNTVYGQTEPGGMGIFAFDRAVEVLENLVHTNYDGIYSVSDATILRNRVYNNSRAGIRAAGHSSVRDNVVYTNSVGISGEVWFRGEVLSNLVYANTNSGISLRARDALVANNTVYQIVGDAVRVEGASRNVTLRNNLLWAEEGFDLYITPDSQTGFRSDDNLLHQGTDPKAHVGFWGGVVRDTLSDWQAASLLDGRSLAADPLWVDRDGADNVLGYRPDNGGYDGGLDDNFYLRRASPAIDRGESWAAPQADIEGRLRRDDPGTANNGTPEYFEAELGASFFATSGTAMNWRFNDTFATLALPFAFPFYDGSYSSVNVSSEGFLHFAGPDSPGDGANSVEKLIANRRIASLWDNLRTDGPGNDIFVDTAVAGQITIRWQATNEADGSQVHFAVTLFSNGRIQFHYGPGNTNLTPTVGISLGNGLAYRLSLRDGQSTLTNARSVQFTLAPGLVDLGAYEFPGSSLDTTLPVVVSTQPPDISSGNSVLPTLAEVTLNFSEPLNPISARSPALFTLIEAGADTVFGTRDDLVVPIASLDYTPGGLSLRLGFVPPLEEGLYRLTVTSSPTSAIYDLAGNALDGDRNGTAGGHFVLTFLVHRAPMLQSISINNGLAQRSRVSSLTLQFSKDVSASLGTDDLVLRNLSTASDISATSMSISYDTATQRATLTFPGLPDQKLPEGNYRLRVVGAGIRDRYGVSLPGDTVVQFHVLTGDANGDRVTNDRDLYQVWQNLLRSPGARNLNEDLTGDSQVTLEDVNVVKSNYLAQLPEVSALASLALEQSAPASSSALALVQEPLATEGASWGSETPAPAGRIDSAAPTRTATDSSLATLRVAALGAGYATDLTAWVSPPFKHRALLPTEDCIVQAPWIQPTIDLPEPLGQLEGPSTSKCLIPHNGAIRPRGRIGLVRWR
jgi:parallel beta-helix repeat protein